MSTINPANLGWITLPSKYNNKCKICDKEIPIGTKCLWKKGEGVKCLENCVAQMVDVEPPKKLITEQEWKDFQKYNWETLQKITNCQCCGNPLNDENTDKYFADDRRVCYKCF